MAPLDDSNALVCGGDDDASAYVFGVETSVTETEKEAFTVYPNPTSDVLYCPECRGEYQIFDMTGRKLVHGKWQTLALDVSGLSTGIYTLYSMSGSTRFVVN